MALQVRDTCPPLGLDDSLGILWFSILQQVNAKVAPTSQPCLKQDSEGYDWTEQGCVATDVH